MIERGLNGGKHLLYEYCIKYDADIAIGNYKTFGENDEIEVVFVTSWGKLIKRKLISNNLFPKGKIHEDIFTTYKLLFSSKKIVYTSNKLYYYLHRSSSIMGLCKNPYNADAVEGLERKIS